MSEGSSSSTADESRHHKGFDSGVFSSVAPMAIERNGPASISTLKMTKSDSNSGGVGSRTFASMCKWSWLPSLIFFTFGIFCMSAALLTDRWAGIRIDYKSGPAVGRSHTMLGFKDLKRLDFFHIFDATMMLSRTLPYTTIINDSYCAEDINGVSKVELDDYPAVLRRIDQVGLLDHDKEVEFIAKHGRVIYDVLCSSIPKLAHDGYVLLTLLPMSFILYFPLIIMCLLRNIFDKTSTPKSWYETIEIVAIITWVISLVLGAIGLTYYWVSVSNPLCVNGFGELTGCVVHSSVVLTLLYVLSSFISLVSYVFYGISVKKGAGHGAVRWTMSGFRRDTEAL
ncbi:hypothetical protein, conserved [Babesia bigemina]|uniref:Uncharacterized protein n=1 Tax=Babesia bigemina TaxID=5866 RepID=A0A061D498_BABBI|nr:hypothetical protein, conserved [Babesia bigemina]CDR95566.1 hypothetical protein, conserved [Babesia bigemina]|eukprot:XP_012767752.1 hypothetical protein, conserved [Babesia bigemina]